MTKPGFIRRAVLVLCLAVPMLAGAARAFDDAPRHEDPWRSRSTLPIDLQPWLAPPTQPMSGVYPSGALDTGTLLATSGSSTPDLRDRAMPWLSPDALGPLRYRVWVPTLAVTAAVAVLQLAVDPPDDPRWTSTNSFDEELRRALRGGTSDDRDGADIASDVLFGTLGAGLVVDWIALRDEYDPWDSAGIDAGWFFSNTLTTRIAKVSAGRERPFVEPCGLDPDYVSNCDAGSDGNASFFSGHASESATLAGLLCARHLHRRERGRLDVAICGAAVAASAATGVLRISADQHWATDVLVGWISGGIFGYVLPSLIDYRGEPDSAAGRTLALLRHLEPMPRPATWGLRASFRF